MVLLVLPVHPPPRQGGKPRPNTAPMSPSTGLFRMPSCRHSTASFTNRDTSRYCTSESDELHNTHTTQQGLTRGTQHTEHTRG